MTGARKLLEVTLGCSGSGGVVFAAEEYEVGLPWLEIEHALLLTGLPQLRFTS